MPPLAAVAAMERASMRATADICPLAVGLEPSRLGKFLVVWRMLNALLEGVSPAPKQGPQKAVLMMEPLDIISAMAPFRVSSIATAWEEG